jgi:hypothetical protein
MNAINAKAGKTIPGLSRLAAEWMAIWFRSQKLASSV